MEIKQVKQCVVVILRYTPSFTIHFAVNYWLLILYSLTQHS